MTELCVPYLDNGISDPKYRLYNVTMKESRVDFWNIAPSRSNDTIIVEKFKRLQSYFEEQHRKQYRADFYLKTQENIPPANIPAYIQVLDERTKSVFLGIFLKAEWQTKKLKFKKDWEIVCATGDLDYDTTLNLHCVRDIDRKYRDEFIVKAEGTNKKCLFLYVSDDKEVIEGENMGKNYNITVKRFSPDEKINDIIDYLFNIYLSEDEEEAQKKYLDYLKYECIFEAEGLPVPREVQDRRMALEETFVPLRLAIIPKNWDEIKSEFNDRYLDDQIFWYGLSCPVSDKDDKFNNPFRAVIFSGPGGGKTTYMRRLVSAYGLGKIDNVTDHLPNRPLFPVLIKCRDFKDIGELAIQDIIRRIPTKTEFAQDQQLTVTFHRLVTKHIDYGDAMFLIDGLDEIKDTSSRLSFINQIKLFADTYKKVNIVMSSRLIGFKQITNNLFSNFYLWLILPFNKNEIVDLCDRWYKILFEGIKNNAESARKLSDAIISNERIYKLAQIPILLTILLLVNEQQGGRLPIRRTDLYRVAIEVLLDTWGRIIRKSIDLRKALPHLAYLAHKMMFSDESQQKIREEQLLGILEEAQKNLERYSLYSATGDDDRMFFRDPYDFIDKIEERSSLLVNRGYHFKEGTTLPEREYEFLHLTFQEYLTAYAIINSHYHGASDNSIINDCFEENWENPVFKEVILLTSVLTDDGRLASKLIQGILDRLEAVKASRNSSHQYTVIYLKNLLLQIIADEASLTPSDRETIYRACFSSSIDASIFRNEFFSLYESNEYKNQLTTTLLQLDQERKYPIYSALTQFLEDMRLDSDFSMLSYYKKTKDTKDLLEAIKVLYIFIWLEPDTQVGLERKKMEFRTAQVNKELINELLGYCMSDDEKLAFFAYQALYGLCKDKDPVLNGKLLQSLLRFSSESDITQRIDKFPVTQDTLIFLHGNFPTEVQIEALNANMEQEMDPQKILWCFKFGTLCGAWDIVTIIQKAKSLHSADYIKQEDSVGLLNWMQSYLSVLKETNWLTNDQKVLVEEYQHEAT